MGCLTNIESNTVIGSTSRVITYSAEWLPTFGLNLTRLRLTQDNPSKRAESRPEWKGPSHQSEKRDWSLVRSLCDLYGRRHQLLLFLLCEYWTNNIFAAVYFAGNWSIKILFNFTEFVQRRSHCILSLSSWNMVSDFHHIISLCIFYNFVGVVFE